MEKKTIGAFIATLRKANGMTQRDLAERLNVSDKTVSRWERDDGAPDLSLIPVIAELFGVTCDELLRGERRNADTIRENDAGSPVVTPKGEKAIRHLIQNSLQRYRTHSLISAVTAFTGLVAAMIANIAFLRGYIGFFLGLMFYGASVVCQWIFTDRAWMAVTEDAVNESDVADYRWQVFRIASVSIGAAFTAFCATLPLLLSGGAYYGLTVASWLGLALLACFAALILWYAVMCLVRGRMLRNGVLILSETAQARLNHNMRLQRKLAVLTAAALAATLFLHVCVSEIWNAWAMAKGEVFNDYDSFVEYMAQPISGPWGFTSISVEYADMEELPLETLTLADGTVVCEFQRLNENVARIEYTEKDGTLLPIEVITYTDVEIASTWELLRNVGFSVLYVAEIACALMIYTRKRQK